MHAFRGKKEEGERGDPKDDDKKSAHLPYFLSLSTFFFLFCGCSFNKPSGVGERGKKKRLVLLLKARKAFREDEKGEKEEGCPWQIGKKWIGEGGWQEGGRKRKGSKPTLKSLRAKRKERRRGLLLLLFLVNGDQIGRSWQEKKESLLFYEKVRLPLFPPPRYMLRIFVELS